MRVFGIDFTSTPRKGKPITVAKCELRGDRLVVNDLDCLPDMAGFERQLALPGHWVAGLDFPFGQPRKLIANLGWPLQWEGMVDRAARLDRPAFVDLLDRYRSQRAKGDKEHLRSTDRRFGALSPMKVYGTPLAKMFHEGAPRLQRSSLNVVPVRASADPRTAIEAYPGAAVRSLLGRRRVSYKHDTRRKQTTAHEAVREEILTALRGHAAQRVFGFRIVASEADLSVAVDDPSGDVLDSLLCACQAAWSWQRRNEGWGVPAESDLLEGWICHPQDATPGATPPRTPT